MKVFQPGRIVGVLPFPTMRITKFDRLVPQICKFAAFPAMRITKILAVSCLRNVSLLPQKECFQLQRQMVVGPLHEGLDARKRVVVGPFGNAHHVGAISIANV